MEVTIEQVPVSSKHIISNLIELYSHDFSELSPEINKFDLNENGRFEYPILDKYWEDEQKIPYLIKYNSKIVGFMLVDKSSVFNLSNSSHQITEFFVLRKYRRKGIGTTAASHILQSFKNANWEIPILRNNIAANEFWIAIIKKVAKHGYKVIEANTPDWKGPVLSFEI